MAQETTFLGLTTSTWLAILISTGLGVLVGLVTGFIGSLLANRVYEVVSGPLVELGEDPGAPAIGSNPSIGPLAFFHVAAFAARPRFRLLGHRRPARAVRADIVIWDAQRQRPLISGPARWAGWPEPVAMVQVQAASPPGTVPFLPVFDNREASRQRNFAFDMPGQIEQLDLVLKVEGQDEVFFWNNDNYRYGWLHVGHRLGLGDYHAEVTLRYEGRVSRRWFLLHNGGRSWRDVRVRALP